MRVDRKPDYRAGRAQGSDRFSIDFEFYAPGISQDEIESVIGSEGLAFTWLEELE